MRDSAFLEYTEGRSGEKGSTFGAHNGETSLGGLYTVSLSASASTQS